MKTSTKKNVARKGITFAWVVSIMTVFGTIGASADGVSGIVDWIKKRAEELKTIGYAIGIIAVIVLGIVMIAGGSQGIQKGKGIAISILVGIAVLGFGTGIIGSLQGSTSGGTAAKTYIEQNEQFPDYSGGSVEITENAVVFNL